MKNEEWRMKNLLPLQGHCIGMGRCACFFLYYKVSFVRMCQNSTHPTSRDIFLYLSVCNILISNGCLADKYKNMSLLVAVWGFWHILMKWKKRRYAWWHNDMYIAGRMTLWFWRSAAFFLKLRMQECRGGSMGTKNTCEKIIWYVYFFLKTVFLGAKA